MTNKSIYFFVLFFISTILVSCSGKSDAEIVDDESQKSCFYSYNEAATTLEWTAYKTSEKVEVMGSFNEIEVKSESGESQLDVLESISFSINTASVETNNEDRNKKISEHFFQTINTDKITGKMVKVKENGKSVIAVTMNGITINVEGDSNLEGDTFTFETSLDMSKWNALLGITTLNKVCKDLHAGPDGISMLWSEIGLKFSTTLASDCD